ncbi:GntR family transcriptional regulator [Streptomyces kronopolitis]|uniref:GntR family transcriptional regulator n=1 Tax=Streptomyces kronopolitis TaxID=1612435 RepID=UPI003D962A9E
MPSERGLPPYRQIAEEIIDKIRSGELEPGDAIPSARDIVRDKGVSSATAARVPGVLRAQGYAETKPGIGTFVRKPKPITVGTNRLGRMLGARPTVGDGERVEILDLNREPASQEVADGLGVELGTEVGRRRRRYLDAGGVVTVSATWVTGAVVDAAPAFLEPAPLPRLTFGLVEEATGRRVARRRDTYEQRPVPADVAEHLGVPAGSEALAIINHYWDADGDPTEFAIDFIGPGRSCSAEYDVE